MTKAKSNNKSLLRDILRRFYCPTHKAFFRLVCLVVLGIIAIALSPSIAQPQGEPPLWQVYERSLKHNGYAQAEAVANLDKVPETGALVAIGYPKFQGGTGGYARYIAICPPNWKYGISVGQVPESPLPRASKPLQWDENLGVRNRG